MTRLPPSPPTRPQPATDPEPDRRGQARPVEALAAQTQAGPDTVSGKGTEALGTEALAADAAQAGLSRAGVSSAGSAPSLAAPGGKDHPVSPGGLDPYHFACLQRPGRVWAVAAIHGEADTLANLHDRLAAALRPEDRLVYLGNYIGWGEACYGAIAELIEFRRRFLALPGRDLCDLAYVRGNQEEMWQKLLQIQFAASPAEVLRWMLDQGVESSLRAYGGSAQEAQAAMEAGVVALARWTHGLRLAMRRAPGHEAFFAGLRKAAWTEDGSLLFVHAGLDPAQPLARQGDILWWGGGFSAITAPYQGFKVVIRGYDRAHAGVATTAHTATIDGGCGFGGPLLAACFNGAGQIVDLIEGS